MIWFIEGNTYLVVGASNIQIRYNENILFQCYLPKYGNSLAKTFAVDQYGI